MNCEDCEYFNTASAWGMKKVVLFCEHPDIAVSGFFGKECPVMETENPDWCKQLSQPKPFIGEYWFERKEK